MSSKSEQETTIWWDEGERVLHLYTAYPPHARQWKRLGYPVNVRGRTKAGEPRSWEAEVPVAAVWFRPVVNGQVAKRGGGLSLVFATPPELDQATGSSHSGSGSGSH
jgi:hypothetical protein